MTFAALPKGSRARSLFADSGESTAKLPLIIAVYFDRTQVALDIIRSDPEQINLPEPYAGLTPLHIAVFRQNIALVEAIARHPIAKPGIEDRFGRTAIDLCAYTSNDMIFRAIIERTYQSALIALDNEVDHAIVPFKK